MPSASPIPKSLFSLEAEMSVLGGILVDDEGKARAKAFSMVEEDMYHLESHQLLHRSLKEMWEKGEVIDAITLSEHMKRSDTLEKVGMPYVAQLLDAVPTAANIEYHCKIVKEKAALRKLREVAAGIIVACESGKHSPQPIVDRTLSRMTEIVVHYDTTGVRVMTREDLLEDEMERLHRDGTETWSAPVPWPKMAEQLTGGFIPGDVVLIPGYSNSGKTNLAANLNRYWVTMGFHQKWYPTESMGKYLSRVAAIHARVPQVFAERDAWHLASPEQKEAYQLALQDLFNLGKWDLHSRAKVTPEEIIALSTQHRKTIPDGEPLIITVDHLHRLNYGGVRPQMMVGDTVQRLRDWAKESTLKGDPTILVLLAQPKKPDLEIAQYKPVGLYGTAGEGMVAAEADIVLSPYRHWSKIDPNSDPSNPRILLKNGKPVHALPGQADAVLDRKYFSGKFVKRRTEGEGDTIFLPIDGPSGYIYPFGVLEPDSGDRTGTDD